MNMEMNMSDGEINVIDIVIKENLAMWMYSKV